MCGVERHVIEPQELEAGGSGLDGEGLEHRAAQMAGFQRLGQRVVIDHRPARRVDEDRALAHGGEFGPADEAERLRGHPRVQGDDVAFPKQRLGASSGPRRRARPRAERSTYGSATRMRPPNALSRRTTLVPIWP